MKSIFNKVGHSLAWEKNEMADLNLTYYSMVQIYQLYIKLTKETINRVKKQFME
jgi:hypothetical protein